MTTINSDQFRAICNTVWHNRVEVVRGGGDLSAELALVRAVFWQLCKAGIRSSGYSEKYASTPTILAYELVMAHMLEVNARPAFDGGPILKELVERYQNEVTVQSLETEKA